MAGLPHDWTTAVARNIVVKPAGAFHVANNCRARTLLQDGPREDDHQLVAPHDSLVFINRSDAIGITIVGNADSRATFSYPGLQVAHIVLDGRVGMMMREAAVHLDIKFDCLHSHLAHERDRHRTATTIATINGDLDRGQLDITLDILLVIGQHWPVT